MKEKDQKNFKLGLVQKDSSPGITGGPQALPKAAPSKRLSEDAG